MLLAQSASGIDVRGTVGLQSAGCSLPAGASGSGSNSAEAEREMPLASGSGHCSSSLRCLSFWRISVSGRSCSCSTSLLRFLQAADTLPQLVSLGIPGRDRDLVAKELLQSSCTRIAHPDNTALCLREGGLACGGPGGCRRWLGSRQRRSR